MRTPERDEAGAIERRLLDLAYTTDIKITAPALAYYAPCSIEAAAAVLDGLAARDRVHMDVEDDGTVVYRVPGREKLAATAAPIAAPVAPRVAPEPALSLQAYRGASPLIAAALSICVPGAGHLYAGRFFAAVMWFFAVSIGYILILPGLLLHIASIASAARATREVATPRRPLLFAA